MYTPYFMVKKKDIQEIVSKTFYEEHIISSKKSKAPVVALVVLLFFVALLIVLVVGSTRKKTLFDGKVYFAVTTQDYLLYSKAQVDADNIKEIGGAGYIMIDDGTKIVMFVYNNQNDALNISNSIKQYDTQVVQIKFDKINASTKKELLKDTRIKEMFIYIDNQLSDWYQHSIDLERDDITSANVLNHVLRLKNRLTAYSIYLSSVSSELYLIIDSHINNMIDDTNGFFEIMSDEMEFKGRVKHLYVSLLIECQNLIKNIAAQSI